LFSAEIARKELEQQKAAAEKKAKEDGLRSIFVLTFGSR
jgi:hypothetical protein